MEGGKKKRELTKIKLQFEESKKKKSTSERKGKKHFFVVFEAERQIVYKK